VAALFADGETVIQDVTCANTSFPGFARVLAEAAPACAICEETSDA
jgi:5-enolpyruvylshikimate-3-phosphate synthase